MNKRDQKIITDYARIFGQLSPATLPDLRAMLSDDIIFQDPFSRLSGPAAFIAVFEHMFKVMDRPAFEITDIGWSDSAGYIQWKMTGQLRRLPSVPVAIIGLSEVRLDKAGQIIAHIDHWDSASQLLAHLPVIGWFVRRVLRLFSQTS